MSHLKHAFDELAKDIADLEADARRLAEKANAISIRFHARLEELEKERQRHQNGSAEGNHHARG